MGLRLLGRALAAKAFHLNTVGGEAESLGEFSAQFAGDFMGGLFNHLVAAGANEHQGIMTVVRRGSLAVTAGDKHIQAVDPVDQLHLDQEIKRPIHRHGRDPAMGVPHVIVQVVGLGRAPALQQEFQHFTAQGRKQGSAIIAELLGLG
jgi:hypothetical protein